MRRPPLLALAVVALASASPALAHAQAAPVPPPYAPPPEPQGARTHDGLYLRGSLGIGGLWATRTFRSSGGDVDASTSAALGTLDVSVGLTPVPGLVFGGSFLTHFAPAPKTSSEGSTWRDGSLSLRMLAFTADWYPRPHRGFHLGGSIGGASVSTSGADARTAQFDARGPALAFMLGHDFWAGDDLSVGLLGRFLAAAVSEQGAYRNETVSPTVFYATTVGLSVVYH